MTNQEMQQIVDQLEMDRQQMKSQFDQAMTLVQEQVDLIVQQVAITEHSIEQMSVKNTSQEILSGALKNLMEDSIAKIQGLQFQIEKEHADSAERKKEQFSTNAYFAAEITKSNNMYEQQLSMLQDIIAQQNQVMAEMQLSMEDLKHPYLTAARELKARLEKHKAMLAEKMDEVDKQVDDALTACKEIIETKVAQPMSEMKDSAFHTAKNAAEAALANMRAGYNECMKLVAFCSGKLNELRNTILQKYQALKNQKDRFVESCQEIDAEVTKFFDKSGLELERFGADLMAEIHMQQQEHALEWAKKYARRYAAKKNLISETDKELHTLNQRMKAAMHAFQTISTPYVPEEYKPSAFAQTVCNVFQKQEDNIRTIYLSNAQKHADKANAWMDKADALDEKLMDFDD